MDARDLKLKNYFDINRQNCSLVEPEDHVAFLKEKVSEFIKIHNPLNVLKIGIFSHDLIIDIAKVSRKLIIVEPSIDIIRDFIGKNQENPLLEKIMFINSEISELAVDFNVVDMLICTDIFDVIQSGLVMEEFKRVIQFEGLLVFSGVVLNSEDLEGVMDDYFRGLNEIHNDYYLPEDLKTFMKMKKFSDVQEVQTTFEKSLKDQTHFIQKNFENFSDFDPEEFLKQNIDAMERLYSYKEDGRYTEHYSASVFRKELPNEDEERNDIIS